MDKKVSCLHVTCDTIPLIRARFAQMADPPIWRLMDVIRTGREEPRGHVIWESGHEINPAPVYSRPGAGGGGGTLSINMPECVCQMDGNLCLSSSE